MTEDRTSTAEQRRAGDPDTREEPGATGEPGPGPEGMEAAGALTTGSPGENSGAAGMTGSEEAAWAGPEVEVTQMTTVGRRTSSTTQRTWAEAGTAEGEGGRLEEEVHHEEVMTVTVTGSKCMMGRLRLVESDLRPCRGWTWRLCPPASVRGRTDQEQETSEIESPPELMEVACLQGRTAVMVRLVVVDEAAGVLEAPLVPGEEDLHPEECRGAAFGAGSPEFRIKNSHGPLLLRMSPCRFLHRLETRRTLSLSGV